METTKEFVMDHGYIKLYRGTMQHSLRGKGRPLTKLEAWIDILMEVNFKPAEVMLGNEWVTCGAGESVNSQATWASRWKWANSKVRRFLKLLEDGDMIELKPCTKSTHLSVCNWGRYQSERIASESQVNHKRIASESQTATNKKDNKGNKDKKDNNLSPSEPEDEGGIQISEKDVVSRWNALASVASLPLIQKCGVSRKKHLRARLRECPEFWEILEREIPLLGEFALGKNDRGWLIDFDWVITGTGGNFIKLCEGKYRDRNPVRKDKRAWSGNIE